MITASGLQHQVQELEARIAKQRVLITQLRQMNERLRVVVRLKTHDYDTLRDQYDVLVEAFNQRNRAPVPSYEGEAHHGGRDDRDHDRDC